MSSRSTVDSSAHRPRYFAKENPRRLVVSVVVLSVFALGGGSFAVALGAIPHSSNPRADVSTLTRHSRVVAPPTQHWSVSRSESSAPVVGIPGGATLGGGNFNAVNCDSTGRCVAVGADANSNALAAVSVDGGATWKQSAVLAGTPALTALTCQSAARCVAVGQGVTATSNDGGATWTNEAIPATNTTLLSVSCATATTCVSVGVTSVTAGPYGGELLVSNDAGAKWTAPSLPANIGALGSVTCASKTFCVAVGAAILVSSDGGATWSQRFVNGGTGVLRSVSCASATTCVAIGPNPLSASTTNNALEVVTSDGGTTWTSVVMPAGSASVDTVSCAFGGSCHVAGPSLNGAPPPFLTSADAGASWSALSPPSSLSAITAISCVSAGACYFVGSSGGSPASGSTNASGTWQLSPVTIAFTPVSAALR